MLRYLCVLVFAVLLCNAIPLFADQITVSGIITQSTQNGTGPAVNNPSLNGINDTDPYSVTLNFTGAISAPGTYNLGTDLTGATLVFSDATASASETAFDYPNSTLQISQSAGVDTISLLGCLTTGSACDQGNQLDLYFTIPASGLNSQNVTASAVPSITPFELLEDDGVTDIFGTVASYSYTASSPSTVPEPGSMALLFSGLATLAPMWLRRRSRKPRSG